MKIDLDTACEWPLENAIFSQSEVTDRFDEEDLVNRFGEAMEKEEICDKLCMEAKIGDVFNYKEKQFTVVDNWENTHDCAECIFCEKGECALYSCNSVTPCGGFDNMIGKPVIFIETKEQ